MLPGILLHCYQLEEEEVAAFRASWSAKPQVPTNHELKVVTAISLGNLVGYGDHASRGRQVREMGIYPISQEDKDLVAHYTGAA